MVNQTDLQLIRGDAIAMETIRDCMMCMKPKDRMHYVDIVTEAMADDEKNIALIYQLYKDVSTNTAGQNTEVVLKLAAKTKGDFTKYEYYPVVIECMKILESFECSDLESVQLIGKLKNILLNYREDFAFAYKHTLNTIIKTYVELILSLNLMIDCAIADIAHAKELSFNAKRQAKPGTGRTVVKHVKTLINAFECGLFAHTMKSYKKAMASGNAPMEGSITTATEASFTINVDLNKAADKLAIVGGKLNPFKLFKNVATFLFTGTGKAARIAQVFAILISMRFLWGWFNNKMAKLSDFARNQAELVKASIDADKAAGNDASKRQLMMHKFMKGAADLIDYKILKIDNETTKSIAQDTRNTMSPEAITNSINGLDFS